MKYLLSLVVLFCPALAHAGNHGCRVAAVPYVQHHAVAVKQVFVAQPYFAVGQYTQLEAQIARANQPLLDEIKALRAEQAAFRQEAKTGFSNLSAKFSFRGQGTFTVEGSGDGDSDITPVPVDPGPNPVDPPVDAAPPLTPAMKVMFKESCAACHTGKATGFDVDRALTFADAVQILTRVESADPAFQMPKKGSSEKDREAVRGWMYGNLMLMLEGQLREQSK